MIIKSIFKDNNFIQKIASGKLLENVETYAYDANNMVTRITVSSGGLTHSNQREYDMIGRITREVNEDGLVTSWTYVEPAIYSVQFPPENYNKYSLPAEGRGLIVTKTLPGGFTEIKEYYMDGRIKSITGTAQPSVFYNYAVTVSDNLFWTVQSFGSENSSLWVKTYENMLGQTVKIEESGYNGSVITTQHYFDSRGRMVKSSKTGRADLLYVYDDLGNLIRSGLDVDGNGTLDLASNDRVEDSETLFRQIDSAWWSETTKTIYGTSGSATATILNTLQSRLTGFSSGILSEKLLTDRFGNQTISTTSTDRNNKTSTTTMVYPDSTVSAQEIVVNGLLLSSRSKTNLTTTYSYDALGRKIGVTDPRTGTITLAYYADGTGKKGKIQTITDAAGNATTYDYDETSGRKKSVRNALNKYTYYDYNAFGQTTHIWGDSEYPVSLGYNDLGQQISLTTYRTGSAWNGSTWPTVTGDTTTWTYDSSSGLVTAKTDANSKATAYTYRPDGQLLTRTWARQNGGNPLTTTYTYNSATGELLKADYSDTTTDIERTYNRLGKLATVTDAAGTRMFTYDGDFNLTGESISGLYSKSLAYTYATSGVIGRYTGMTGNHAYSYDSYGRLSQINDIAYSRIANSNLPGTVTRPNNANTTWSYETNRDLVTNVANGMLSTYAYVNDAIARRTSMTKSGSVFQQTEVLGYTYNDRSEVTGAVSDVNQNYSYSYAFDPIGNRTNATLAGTAYSYTANLLNQYTAVNTDTPTYDDDGNMLTSGAWTYAWNGENRLVSATNGTQRLEFAYDYMGRRIFKKVYSGETLTKYLKFVYDGYKLVEELDGLNSDALSHRYVWQTDAVGLDVPVSVYDVTSDKTYFYHTDANKNITELTDNTGAVVAHYEYSPFGMQTVASGAFANDNPFRFSSEYFDSETGLVYYNYRYYSTQLGRWLSRDPIEEDGGLNLYGMLGNSPLGGWDYLGYECDSLDIVNAFLSGLGEGFANIAQGIASSLYGSTVGLGEQFTLTGMDVYNSYFGDDSYQYRSSMFQGTYNISANGGSWGNTIAEATLQISGYRFGNQIYNSLQTGAQTGNWNSFSQNMGQAAFMAGGAALATKAATRTEVATPSPRLVIGRTNDIQPSTKLKPGEYTLISKGLLPDQGTPKANWKQNSSALRAEMRNGQPIRDASVGDTGGIFLNAERNVLQNKGWKPAGDMWYPPSN